MVKVKICGITSLLDAEKSLELGADMLGFNFYAPSPRAITAEKARAIIARLPRESFNIALFVNAARENVTQAIALGEKLADGRQAYRALQFHGEESADYCRGWNLQVIKAFRLKDKAALATLADFSADFYLLDSWSAGYGGSGTAFPWEWLDGFDASKLILSGGLEVDNVAAAIKQIRPFGVDVCSGVETRPGIKDHEKLKEFIIAAKSA